MTSNKQNSDSFTNFTEEKLSELVKANDALDQEEAIWIKAEKEEGKRKAREMRFANTPLRRLRKAPLEIISRSLFWFFLGSFLFSFVLDYTSSLWWFYWYVISACACIFYTPNRKSLKELLDAWPNIVELIKQQK